MAEGELPALKEALRTQQQLLQKLYVELEAEREASSTAANETLSMIWRLQEEKAAQKMEASQYKRMAEEKMKHAEQSMAFFDEIMYQKEMEANSLQFQIQAYRYRLLSMGFSDQDIAEGRFLRQSDAQFRDVGVHGSVRRNQSLSAIQSNDQPPKLGILSREGSATRACEEDLSSYWEQIRQLDERVKALSCGNDVDDRGDSGWNRGFDQPTNLGYLEELDVSSSSSAARRDLLFHPLRGLMRTRVDYEGSSSYSSSQPDDPVNLVEFDESSFQSSETENFRHVGQSSNVHDVFEVPQASETGKLSGQQKQQGRKVVLEGRSRFGKPDTIQEETVEYCSEDEEDEWVKALQLAHLESQLARTRDAISLDCHFSSLDPSTSNYANQAEIQEINDRLEIYESERRMTRQEVSISGGEELRLLRKIHELLKTVKSEIRSIKNNKSSPPVDDSLDSIMEAMFFYSL